MVGGSRVEDGFLGAGWDSAGRAGLECAHVYFWKEVSDVDCEEGVHGEVLRVGGKEEVLRRSCSRLCWNLNDRFL